MPKTTLLIDGDVFVYRIGLSAERPIDWGDDLWTLHADLGECRAMLDRQLEELRIKLDADDFIVALSGKTEAGFRRGICPTYKANRKDVRKPIVHRPLRDYLIEKYDTILRPNIEADDVLGILATSTPKGDTRIIVSIDKDFQGVPCNFYRTVGDMPQVVTITAEQAMRFHALQTLVGDRVDGYAGIPGCGPVAAEKILHEVPAIKYWETIVAAYAKAGLSESVALTNARLARILQASDYNTTTGEVKLWTPSPIKPRSKKPSSSARTSSSKATA